MQNVIVLGSTGSIGTQALDVIATHPDEFRLIGISGGNNKDLFIQQINNYCPLKAAFLQNIEDELPHKCVFLYGEEGVTNLAADSEADVIINGISGFAALKPLLASLKAGKRVALANKESIVCGKIIVDKYIKAYGGEIIPVDSEQSAIFQCMKAGRKNEIHKILLTASGGRFWKYSEDQLTSITPEEALEHPTWKMGKKITIDSATLFNKGLEIIEASYLFDIPGNIIDVIIHPQSIVHSMVEYNDGTVIANLSNPDMRLPIQYAMTYPERQGSPVNRLDFYNSGLLEFYPAEKTKFRALSLAYDALEAGDSFPIAFNGSNEIAVKAFLNHSIKFTDIFKTVEYAMNQHTVITPDSIEAINSADINSRNLATQYIKHIS